MTTQEIIDCAGKREFLLSEADAIDIRDRWANPGESVESAVCGWLLTYETCDPDLEIRFGLPANLFS
jgi:hypothetical protein